MGKFKIFSLQDNEFQREQDANDTPVYEMTKLPQKKKKLSIPTPQKKVNYRTFYIADNMLGLPSEIFKYGIWKIDEFDDYVFSRVDSKLEAMVLLGMLYCILRRENSHGNGMGCGPVPSDEELINTLRYNHGSNFSIVDGQIWVSSPWFGWSSNGNGPSSVSIIPQYLHNGRVRDFAVFAQSRKAGKIPKIPDDLYFLIEVDGYAVHNQRREADKARDESAGVPVFVFREESHWPKTFWDDVVLPWIDKIEEECWSLSAETAQFNNDDCPFGD